MSIDTPDTPTATTPVPSSELNFDSMMSLTADEGEATPQTETPKVEAAPAAAVSDEKVAVDADKPVVEGEAVVAESEPEAQTLKLKVGTRGKEVDIPLETRIPVKVDGVDTEVSMADLRNNYAGKVAWDKKFSELDTRDKAYVEDKRATETQLNAILEKAHGTKETGPDALGAILEICKIADLDPSQTINNIKTQIFGDIERLMQMSPEQRDLHFLRIENQALRKSKESASQVQNVKQANRELEVKAREIQEAYGLSDGDLDSAREEIRAADPERVKSLFGAQAPTATQLAQLAAEIKFSTMAINALGSINPELKNDSEMVYLAGVKLSKKPNLTEKEAADYLVNTMKLQRVGQTSGASDKAEKTLSKKIEATRKIYGNDSVGGSEDIQDDIHELNKATSKKSFPMSFDDI